MAGSVEKDSITIKIEVPPPGAALGDAVRFSGMFPRNGPDPSARSWGHNAAGKTFGAQHKILKLPLPSLEHSCRRYLDALQPLQSEEDHAASVEAVQRFLQVEGPILQAQLKEYDEAHLNWFEHYCYEAFLNDDSPVVLNSNAFASFEADPDPERNDQTTRAAALVRSTLEFSQAIREDEMLAEEMRGVPQCMYQYWWLFGVVRVPTEEGGRLRMDADARHIMVMCRGQTYRLYVLEEDTYRIVDERTIRTALQEIINDASQLSAEEVSRSSVGVFTTENQKTWARCRTGLVHGSVRNGRNIAIIDSSIFALCLDDSAPKSRQEICKNMICGTTSTEKGALIGTCLNRWYDKLAVIVCQNGAAGMNFEHTCTDGSADIRMACDIYKGSISPAKSSFQMTQNGTSHSHGAPGRVKKLEWDIPQDVSSALEPAQKHLLERISKHDLATLDFHDYGKSFITSSGLSPDAFFQMVLHAAYHSLSGGRVGNGFEPVLTRSFLHGRTDVARTLTPQCASFVRTFNDPTASPASKLDSLRTACTAHVDKFRECARGHSHHRHLYVLHLLWKRRRAFLLSNGLASLVDNDADPSHPSTSNRTKTTIFTDPGWSRLGTTLIMGSNVDNPDIAYAGFGAPSPDGYTVVYHIRKEYMAMSVNCWNGKAQRYADAIESTFRAVKALLVQEGGREKVLMGT